MIGRPQTQPGELVATRGFRDDVASSADLSNVIPFARARRSGAEAYAPPVSAAPADRPAPPLPDTRPWLHAVLVGCSLIMHGGLFYAFWQQPKLLPGIGSEAMTVEIVVGDNRPQGSGATPGVSQKEGDDVQEAKPDQEAPEDQKVADAREVKPEEGRSEVAKEQPVEQPREQDPEPRQAVAMVETPQAEMPTALPRETPPDMQAVLVPREQPKEVKPVDPKQKRRDKGDVLASGSGVSVSSEANYMGRVSAHLRRFQTYPPSAEGTGITGRGMVTFSISGGGQVASVSVASGTGAAVLDQEMTAMVRRASPFPAPPDGKPRTFNVPVGFSLPGQRRP